MDDAMAAAGVRRSWVPLDRIKHLLLRLRYASVVRASRSVEGWLSDREAIALYRLARAIPRRDAVVVELGSWVGKSSVVLALGLRGKSGATLYCVDPFNADGDAESRADYAARAPTGSLQDAFLRNIERHRVADIVRVLPGYSHAYAATFDRPADLLFVDANHDYDAVRRDLTEWGRHVRAGGVLALHDVADYCDGPRRAAAELLAAAPEWRQVAQIDTLLVIQRGG